MGNSLTSPVTNLHIERASNDYFHAAAGSVHGWRMTMEDQHNILTRVGDKPFFLFGVYDGHGGPLAAEYLRTVVPEAFEELENITDYDAITKIMLNLDQDFLQTGHEDGATSCIVLVQPYDTEHETTVHDFTNVAEDKRGFLAVGVNIGDSRAIVLRTNDEDYDVLTYDHKPDNVDEARRIMKAGGHVQHSRVDGSLALSRAIGDRAYKDNHELGPTEQKVIAVPEFERAVILPGQYLLVACDGIFEASMYSDRENVVALCHDSIAVHKEADSEFFDPAAIVRDIIAQSITAGSHDNHSAIMVRFGIDLPPLTLSKSECVPGPFESVYPDDTFKDTYISDLKLNDIDFDEILPKIKIVDELCESLPTDYEDDIKDEHTTAETFSVRPIILKSSQPEQREPVANQLRSWFNYAMQNNFDADEDDY